MFISIGASCDVKFFIDKVNGPKATLFFDWLITDMASVNAILGTNDINSILFVDNIMKNPNIPSYGSTARIVIKSLSLCESIHDVPVACKSFHISEFIETYKRRYNRIIHYILNNKSEIYFIRKGKITSCEKNTFIKNIQNINSECKFKLVELLEQKTENDYFISEKNVISVNLDNYRINSVNDNWKSECWNWKQIFYDIKVQSNIDN